jgi:hypothetical protein
MQVSPDTKEQLRMILRGTSGGLRDFLQPKELPDDIGFVLMESLIVAEKART